MIYFIGKILVIMFFVIVFVDICIGNLNINKVIINVIIKVVNVV